MKVFFLNPVHEKMKACEHYFSGSCSFGEECRFSHGEVISHARLKPYQPPNYSLLKRRSHVLVKTETSLWKPGTVMECNNETRTCRIKLHGKIIDCCAFSDILPPVETNSDSESSDLSTDESDNDFTPSSVLQIDENFGEWEKFTKGFGTKILEKFGYVNGQGLGKCKNESFMIANIVEKCFNL